ncbi:MAG: acyl-ACP--UDP-N-acetylglucosamine O-acyltransferase [Candidatus Omnitrophica bacterium]|nr:acyl-ACP--UDP-N-acetylglucosamine O-acyltransferase [Candidatus Omnitrophota bacterium]
MSKEIHSTAVVSKRAKLGKGVVVGPYVVIEDDVKIGDSTVVEAFAKISKFTEIGKKCHIFSYAAIGGISQDLKYKETQSFTVIGNHNTIRECVTINRGTETGSKTIIGNDNHIMAYSHIAHDCTIGDNCIFANCATLAGYVDVGSRAVIGGLSAVHQFCRVGVMSIVGGCSKVVQDIPPYSMCDGHPAKVCGLNLVGLRRAKVSKDLINALKKTFKIIFFENHSFDEAASLVKKEVSSLEEVSHLLEFITSSKRGIAR